MKLGYIVGRSLVRTYSPSIWILAASAIGKMVLISLLLVFSESEEVLLLVFL